MKISTEYASDLLEGTRYIPLMERYFGRLPWEFPKDYKYEVDQDLGCLKLVVEYNALNGFRTKEDVMVFRDIEVDVDESTWKKIKKIWKTIS